VAYVVALLFVGFILGWFFEKLDFEVVLDLFTVLWSVSATHVTMQNSRCKLSPSRLSSL